MFILLHRASTELSSKEVVINTDHIVYMNPSASCAGTFIQTSTGDDDWFVVAESISDIFARMRKE